MRKAALVILATILLAFITPPLSSYSKEENLHYAHGVGAYYVRDGCHAIKETADGLPCETYTIKKGDYLIFVAKRYNLKLEDILGLAQNQYLKTRAVPERLKPYYQNSWDLIYPNDKVTLPLVSHTSLVLKSYEKETAASNVEKEKLNAENARLLSWVGILALWAGGTTILSIILILLLYRAPRVKEVPHVEVGP